MLEHFLHLNTAAGYLYSFCLEPATAFRNLFSTFTFCSSEHQCLFFKYKYFSQLFTRKKIILNLSRHGSLQVEKCNIIWDKEIGHRTFKKSSENPIHFFFLSFSSYPGHSIWIRTSKVQPASHSRAVSMESHFPSKVCVSQDTKTSWKLWKRWSQQQNKSGRQTLAVLV